MTDPHEEEGPDLDREQPFVQHLLELRDCLLRAIVGVLVIFIALFAFANDIYTPEQGKRLLIW